MTEPILVWRFERAPAEYKRLSNHGGDEDWLAILPKEYAEDWLGWAETGTPFGCCEVQRVEMPDGSVVLIGAHA